MTSLLDELRAVVPTRQQPGDWFGRLPASEQQQILDVCRRKIAGELPHSWHQIAQLLQARHSLSLGTKYIASKLINLGAACQEKHSRKK